MKKYYYFQRGTKQMLEIISRLIALKNTLKLYHWNIKGQAFNADHPYLDEIEEPIDNFIDELIEKYFMAVDRTNLPVLFDVFKTESSKYYGEYSQDPEIIFKNIENMLIDLQDLIEDFDTYRGVNAILDELSAHLLKYIGLIKSRISE